MKKLGQDFFIQPATIVAPLLLGKFICRLINGNIYKFKISETEVYYGENDTACHAHKGKTPRTATMYGKCGILYVYLCYGIHYLLNVVTGPENHPEGVLIRAIEEAEGPGRVTKMLEIDKSFNGISLLKSSDIWIEDHGLSPAFTASKRVGIGYASAEDQQRLWRYTIVKTS